MNISKKGCLAVSIISLVIILILCGCAAICVWLGSSISDADMSGADQLKSKVVEEGGEDKIVVIEIEGMIYDMEESSGLFSTTFASVDKISKYIDAAIEDKSVKAIILSMDTPGGEVYASDRLYNKVVEAQTKGIKIITLMRSTAASGGYYVAAPSDKVVASPMTITGSIGVRLDVQSLAGLYEKLGIKTRTITNSNGDYKTGSGLFDEDPNGEVDKIYQRIVDEEYDRFVSIVASGRDMKESEVRKIADGRVFTGKQAKREKLVDELGDFDTAIESANEEAGISDPTIIKYEDLDFWSTLFDYAGLVIKPEVKLLESLRVKPGVRVLYLYEK